MPAVVIHLPGANLQEFLCEVEYYRIDQRRNLSVGFERPDIDLREVA